MPKLLKNKCHGCGQCISVCPFGAVKMVAKYPVIDENCKECGLCAKECRLHALMVCEREIDIHMAEYRGFWVVAVEESEMTLGKVTLELLSEARRLADIKNETVTLLTAGKEVHDNWLKQAAVVGCRNIILLEGLPARYEPDFYVPAVTEVLQKKKPEAVLFPATANGRDLAPKVACRMGTGLTADCTGLDIDSDGNLIQIRPTYGGSVMASIITPGNRPQMASIRANVMKIRKKYSENINIEEIIPDDITGENRIKLVKSEDIKNSFADLGEANIVIAGGYGLKNKENFQKLIMLCNYFNAAAAATRKAVDEGFAPPEIQVGQTGITVAPDIYIAFGISGALQHTLGMQHAKKIIAVNNDPASPIFDICDIAILGDAASVLEECWNLCVPFH